MPPDAPPRPAHAFPLARLQPTLLDWFAGLILLAFLWLGVAYAIANPLFEATDEVRHFRYVRYLQVERQLPPLTAETSKELQAHHPPLYYLMVALTAAPITSDLGPAFTPPGNPYWGFRYYQVSVDNKAQYRHIPAENAPGRDGYRTLWIGRGWSLLFGLGAVLCTYCLGRECFPRLPGVALGGMAFVAFNPMFLHGAASLNNDVPAAFFGAATLWLTAQVFRLGVTPQRGLWLALALGLGTLTKANLLPLGLPAGLVMIIALARQRDRSAWAGITLAGVVILLTTGLWMARNLALTGELLGTGEYTEAWVGEANRLILLQDAVSNLPYTFTTFWARFNYGQIPADAWFYQLYGVIVVSGIAWIFIHGLARLLARARGRAVEPIGAGQFWLPLLALIASLLAWGYLMVTVPATANARLIFPVYPVIGVLIALGWARLRPLATALILPTVYATLAIAALVLYLWPAYAYPGLDPTPQTRANATFADVAELVSYRIEATDTDIVPGDFVDVTVTWRPLRTTDQPLSVFVHFIDDDGLLMAQRDTWPGLGRAPTTHWRPGQSFTDTYRVFIPASAYTPTGARLHVGLWDSATGARLPAFDSAGQPIGDGAPLGGIDVQAIDGPAPHSLSVNFDNTLELLGYQFDRRLLKPGDTLELTTYWWAAEPMDEVYNLFAHLIGPDGEIWARQDSMLLPPTPDWPAEEIRLEIRTLTLDPNAPPGEYILEVGLWREDGQGGFDRLIIRHPDGREMDDFIHLGKLRVE